MEKRAENKLKKLILEILDEHKISDCQVLDVQGLTDIADFMIVASGTSNRHLKATASAINSKVKKAGFMPIGISGDENSGWILIDLGAIIIHLMLPEVRDIYALEKLWGINLEPGKEKVKLKRAPLKTRLKSRGTLSVPRD